MAENKSEPVAYDRLIEDYKTGLKVKFSWKNNFETGFMTKIGKGYEIHEEKYEEMEKRKKEICMRIDRMFDIYG